jgi:hypothetical protein
MENKSIDRTEKIKKMQPYVDKLVDFLITKDISFEHMDGHLENIVLTKGDKVSKIAHHCFYRFSGLCVIGKEVSKGKKSELILIEVDDDMYINTYMRSLILRIFE